MFGGCFLSSKKDSGPNPSDTLFKKKIGSNADESSQDAAYLQDLQQRVDSFDVNSSKEFGGIYSKEDVHSTIYFKFDNSDLSEESKSILASAANELANGSGSKLLIVGHCDWLGTEDYNIKLGERRAGNAESYVESLGNFSGKVETLSLGSTHATQGLSKNDAWRDRRCDIVFFPKKTK